MAIVPFDSHVPSLNGGDRANIRLVAIKANPRANTQLFGLFVCHFLSYSQFRPANKAALAICEMRCHAPYLEALAEILTEGEGLPDFELIGTLRAGTPDLRRYRPCT
jgi:hypothetical protein